MDIDIENLSYKINQDDKGTDEGKDIEKFGNVRSPRMFRKKSQRIVNILISRS
jgi:hypothetical protein